MMERFPLVCPSVWRVARRVVWRCWLAGVLLVLAPGLQARSTHEAVRITGVELVDFPEQFSANADQGEAVARAIAALKEKGYWLTVDELHGVADQVTLYLREQGYQFSAAYLPEQNLASGVLRIRVHQGPLTDIQIVGNDAGYVRSTLVPVFEDRLGQPVYSPDYERGMDRLRQEPRMDVFGYFSRGAEPGEVRLNLRVNRFDRWATDVRMDNYGSPSTGEFRLTAQTSLYSPLHRMDSLTLGVMAAADEDSDERNHYGFITYETPLWSADHRLSLWLGNNVFNVGEDFSVLELEGDARIGELGYRHLFDRQPGRLQWWALDLFYKTTDYDSLVNDPSVEPDEDTRGAALGWQLQRLSLDQVWFTSVYLAYRGGEFENDAMLDQREDFHKADLSTALTWHSRSAKRWDSRITLSLRGQYTQRQLPSVELASFSGAYGLREIEAGFFGADRLALASLEWRFPNLVRGAASPRWHWQPLLLVDGAYGEKLQGSVLEARADAWGVGAGLELSGQQALSARLLVLDLIEAEASNGVEAEPQRVLGELHLRF